MRPARLRDRDGLGDRAEQRALRGIEHAARVELDDDAEHVVVLQQIGNLLERCGDPGEVERIGTQPGEHADIAFRCRRPLLVVHRERQRATARQRADAASGLTFPAASRCRAPNRKLKRISSSAG